MTETAIKAGLEMLFCFYKRLDPRFFRCIISSTLTERVKAKWNKKGAKRSQEAIKIENREIAMQCLSDEVTGKGLKVFPHCPKGIYVILVHQKLETHM